MCSKFGAIGGGHFGKDSFPNVDLLRNRSITHYESQSHFLFFLAVQAGDESNFAVATSEFFNSCTENLLLTPDVAIAHWASGTLHSEI